MKVHVIWLFCMLGLVMIESYSRYKTQLRLDESRKQTEQAITLAQEISAQRDAWRSKCYEIDSAFMVACKELKKYQ